VTRGHPCGGPAIKPGGRYGGRPADGRACIVSWPRRSDELRPRPAGAFPVHVPFLPSPYHQGRGRNYPSAASLLLVSPPGRQLDWRYAPTKLHSPPRRATRSAANIPCKLRLPTEEHIVSGCRRPRMGFSVQPIPYSPALCSVRIERALIASTVCRKAGICKSMARHDSRWAAATDSECHVSRRRS